MIRRAAGLTVLAFAVAGPAEAGRVTIGSTLKADATRYESAPVDSVYWNTELARGRVRVPARGIVERVRFKGRINRKSGATRPNVVMHIQVLRSIGRGKVQVVSTSGDIPLPFGGRANRITTFRPEGMCVRRGDFLALSTSGGFGDDYPDGAEFAMFASVQGSAYRSFTGAGQDMNGSIFGGRTHRNRELLLQARIGTGKDKSFC